MSSQQPKVSNGWAAGQDATLSRVLSMRKKEVRILMTGFTFVHASETAPDMS